MGHGSRPGERELAMSPRLSQIGIGNRGSEFDQVCVTAVKSSDECKDFEEYQIVATNHATMMYACGVLFAAVICHER